MSTLATPVLGEEHPRWENLLEHRFDPSAPEPAGWDDAVAHLDACSACRARALSIDPTLGFRRLPELDVDAAEIEAMQHSVALLRRNRQLSAQQGEVLQEAHQARAWRWWRPAAAALAVGMGLGLAGGSLPTAPEPGVGATATLPVLRSVGAPGSGTFRSFGTLDEGQSFDTFDDPVVEGVESPDARVYQFRASTALADDETIDIAWVIDPNIDV